MEDIHNINQSAEHLETRRGSPVDNRHSTDQLHHFVLQYAKPVQDLEWYKASITVNDLEWDRAVIT